MFDTFVLFSLSGSHQSFVFFCKVGELCFYWKNVPFYLLTFLLCVWMACVWYIGVQHIYKYLWVRVPVDTHRGQGRMSVSPATLFPWDKFPHWSPPFNRLASQQACMDPRDTNSDLYAWASNRQSCLLVHSLCPYLFTFLCACLF